MLIFEISHSAIDFPWIYLNLWGIAEDKKNRDKCRQWGPWRAWAIKYCLESWGTTGIRGTCDWEVVQGICPQQAQRELVITGFKYLGIILMGGRNPQAKAGAWTPPQKPSKYDKNTSVNSLNPTLWKRRWATTQRWILPQNKESRGSQPLHGRFFPTELKFMVLKFHTTGILVQHQTEA